MASKTVKKVWFRPCNCTTPKGMQKRFFKINTLFEHIISEHSDIIETKFLYSNDKNLSTKKTYDEVEEDGFKELLPVDEEKDFRKSEEDINDISDTIAVMSLK